jgi:hypothetical protein
VSNPLELMYEQLNRYKIWAWQVPERGSNAPARFSEADKEKPGGL